MASGRCEQRTRGHARSQTPRRGSPVRRGLRLLLRDRARGEARERAWSTRGWRTGSAEPPGSVRGPRGSRAPEQRSPDRDRSASCRECSRTGEPNGRRPERPPRHSDPRRPRRTRRTDGPRCAGSHRARQPAAAVLRGRYTTGGQRRDPRAAQAAARNLKRAAAPHLTARVEAMYRSPRSLRPIVIPVLVVVAIVGYLVGVHRAPAPSTAASAQRTRIASGSSVLLEYPAGWQPAASAPAIPGLAIAHPLLLAPGGDSGHAGLLSGQLPAGGSSPLPASFLALVRGIPGTEVVDLVNVQAYRYDRLSRLRPDTGHLCDSRPWGRAPRLWSATRQVDSPATCGSVSKSWQRSRWWARRRMT